MIDPLTLEEQTDLEGPPSLLSRAGQGVANAPSEFFNIGSRLLFNLGLQGDQPEAPQIPNIYDLPTPRTFAEKAVDFTTGILPQIPYFMAGEGVAAEAASLLGAGKLATGVAKGAAGFGLIGESDKEPQPLTSAAIGAVMGAAPELLLPLLKRKKLPRPEEQPPSLIPPTQADVKAPLKGEPPPAPAKSAAESAQAMIEAENADEAKSLVSGRLLRERLAFEESQNTANKAPTTAFEPPKSAADSARVIAHNLQEVDNLHIEARGDNASAMLRQHLAAQEQIGLGLPPEGSLVETPSLTEGEALRFSREKRGVTAPEGSLIREPAFTQEEAILGNQRLKPNVATLQPEPTNILKFKKSLKPAKIVGPVLTDTEGNVLAEAKLGANHSDITSPAIEKLMDINPESDLTMEHKFRDKAGKILTRNEAWEAAKANGQIKDGLIDPIETVAQTSGKKPELHSQMLKSRYAPKTPVVTDLKKAPPAKINGVVKADKAKKVATLQLEPKTADTLPSPSEKVTITIDGRDQVATVVSHDLKEGITTVQVGKTQHDVWTRKLRPVSNVGGATTREVAAGGMNEFAQLEKTGRAQKSGLKLRMKPGEAGVAPSEVVSAIARYIALPTVAGAVGYATAEPDNRTASAAAFAIAALGLGHVTPKLLRRIAEANPDVARAGSVSNRIAKVASTAKEIVTADTKVARRVARDQPSASGVDKMILWIARHFTTDAEMIRIKDKAYGIVNDLQKIVQAGQSSLAQMTISPPDLSLLKEYLHGTVTPEFFLKNVSNDSVGRIAVGIRDSFTALSEIFYESLPEGELKNVVAGKADSYMTETFRMFHDAKYRPSEANIEAAAQDLSEEIHGSLENRKAILRAYQHEVQVNRASYGFNKQGSTLGATFGDAVSRKDGDLTPAFKSFLGVYDSPIEEIAATADKLTRAARTAGHFNEIATSEKPNGLKWNYAKPAMDIQRESIEHDIAKAQGQGLQGEVATLQQKLSDLNDYQYNEPNVQHGKLSDSFVDRHVHDALKTYDSMQVNSMSGVIRAMTDATNAIKYGKIILSPLQFARQVVTMPIIGAMSKTHPGDWARAAYSLLKDPAERARLMRTGVLQGDQITGMFKQDFSAIMSGKMSDLFAQSSVSKGLRTWEEAFRTPDLIIRVAAFQKEEARLLAAGKTAAEAEKGGIYFANRYTMNYGAVPPGIKVVRKIPFVNQYLTFAYEISRITKNLMEDAFHNTGVGRVYALSTLTTLATAPFIIQKLTEAQLSPKDLADWNRVKELGPSYNRSDFKFVTGRDAKGNFHYINFTPLLVHDRYQKMTIDAFKGDWTAWAADNPIFGWENTPLLNVATNQITGKDIHTGRELDTIGSRIASIRRDVMPPLLGTDLDKIVQALTPNAEGTLGIRDLQTGQGSSIGDILASYVTSIRGYTVNPDVLTRRALVEAQQASANARGYFYRISKSNATLQQKTQALAEFQTTQKQIMLALRDKLRINPALESNVQ